MNDVSGSSSKPLVSIITPTFNREEFLAHTWRWVSAQTYPNIEWCILDDSPQPSRVIAGISDPRITYRHLSQRLTIGEKRNHLIAAARGEFIAQFDDDDYYAPRFLEFMIDLLEHNQGDMANLSSWYLLDHRHDFFGFWNLRQTTGLQFLCRPEGLGVMGFTADNNAGLMNIHLGFGFTYVYRRSVWQASPFPARDWGEDAHFVQAAARRFRVLSPEDASGLVLHTLHAKSSSSCCAQYRLPHFLMRTLFPAYQSALETLRLAVPASAGELLKGERC